MIYDLIISAFKSRQSQGALSACITTELSSKFMITYKTTNSVFHRFCGGWCGKHIHKVYVTIYIYCNLLLGWQKQ